MPIRPLRYGQLATDSFEHRDTNSKALRCCREGLKEERRNFFRGKDVIG